MPVQLTEGDQQLIEGLRLKPMTVSELIEELGVSANAVRQRLVRLMSASLITRTKCGDEGRGRPCHQYLLTEDGHRTAGNNFPDLAKALWQEVQAIEDVAVRQQVMAGAVKRLVDSFDAEVKGETVEERLSSVQKFFDDRKIPIAVETAGALPVLKVLECPYPDLEDKDHQFCEIEKQLFAKVIGGPVELCQCKKDGDGCCSFESATKASIES
jgi:predicted ArsR family transcriptional regulator